MNTVTVTTKNTASLTLGIISLILGVLGLLVGWIPFIGFLAIPFAIIGGFLGLLGLLFAFLKGFQGVIMPIIGAGICTLSLILPILSTGFAATTMSKAMDERIQNREVQGGIDEENDRTSDAAPEDVSASISEEEAY